MQFEWNENKNKTNILAHRIDFCDAWKIFEKPMLRKIDQRKDYGEERWIGLGQLENVAVIIIYTIRCEKIRIISIRRANRYERQIYEETFGKSYQSS